VVFRPLGSPDDKFDTWDNVRDKHAVWVRFNYAGVNDKRKTVPTITDGAQGRVDRDVSERHKAIYSQITTDSPKYPDSPIVRCTTRP
jgi:hypothetical protein